MSIVILLITTTIAMGFFRLIHMPIVAYVPLFVCIGVIGYGIRGLYRDSPERKNKILPHLQEQSIRRAITAVGARAIHHRRNYPRNRICGILMTGYCGLTIRGSIHHKTKYIHQGISGYLLAGIMSFIASQADIISLELLLRLIISHRIIGMILAHYRRKRRPDSTDALYQNLVYLSYVSIVFAGFVYLPHGIASIIVTIIIGGLLISLPAQATDVTPQNQKITAEDILRGESILNHKTYRTPHRYERIGIQPSHNTLLIRIIIGILISNICYQIISRYSLGQPSIRETMIFFIATTLSVTICVMYYLSHRQKSTPTIAKIIIIILTNIAIGISMVHLFYPHTWSIIIGAIVRNTLNNTILRWIYQSPYRKQLHYIEYYYRMIANIIIMVINSLLMTTRFHPENRETTTIVLLGYRGIQGLLLYPLYQKLYHSKQYRENITI